MSLFPRLTRRGLFKSVLAATIVGLCPRLTRASRAEPNAPEPRQILLNVFSVAGMAYYDATTVIGRMRPGEELMLTAEPTNVHDSFAVVIRRGAIKLGYVPRSDNRHLSRLLAENVPLICRVAEVRPDRMPYRGLRVEVFARA